VDTKVEARDAKVNKPRRRSLLPRRTNPRHRLDKHSNSEQGRGCQNECLNSLRVGATRFVLTLNQDVDFAGRRLEGVGSSRSGSLKKEMRGD